MYGGFRSASGRSVVSPIFVTARALKVKIATLESQNLERTILDAVVKSSTQPMTTTEDYVIVPLSKVRTASFNSSCDLAVAAWALIAGTAPRPIATSTEVKRANR
jgi:hypothetical protein